MNTLQQSITYAGSDSASNAPWVRLEQKPVPDNRLSLADLQAMFSLVVNGVSAFGYLPTSCPARVAQGIISVDMVVWAWPSVLDLDYTLTPTLGELAERTAITQEREFNFTIDFAQSTDLPFFCSGVSWEWTNITCLDKYGREIERPNITATNTAILTSGDFFTVIRVRALAHGYAHPLAIEIGKSGDESITDVEVQVLASWENDDATESETIDLDIPLCAEMLLAACDGTSASEKIYGSVTDENDDKTPVLYYNGCSGKAMAVRYE